MNFLRLINIIRRLDFDAVPEFYMDFISVNGNDLRKKYINILSKNISSSHARIQYLISKELKISGDFIMAARGIPSPASTMLKIIKKNPLEKYNCIPTISLMPLYLGKEDKVIPVYNDMLKSLIASDNNFKSYDEKVNKIDDQYNIIIFPESGKRLSVSSVFKNLYTSIINMTGISDREEISKMISSEDIYILNTVALNRQELLYYPLERSEYDKESVYDLLFPSLLCLLSAGVEGLEANSFIRTVLSMRHSSGLGKKTFIETPYTFDEIMKIYGLSQKYDKVIAI